MRLVGILTVVPTLPNPFTSTEPGIPLHRRPKLISAGFRRCKTHKDAGASEACPALPAISHSAKSMLLEAVGTIRKRESACPAGFSRSNTSRPIRRGHRTNWPSRRPRSRPLAVRQSHSRLSRRRYRARRPSSSWKRGGQILPPSKAKIVGPDDPELQIRNPHGQLSSPNGVQAFVHPREIILSGDRACLMISHARKLVPNFGPPPSNFRLLRR